MALVCGTETQCVVAVVAVVVVIRVATRQCRRIGRCNCKPLEVVRVRWQR